MFWATASCFRPVFEGCKINKMCEFDKGFAFQACFCKVQNVENVRIWQELRVSGLFLKCAKSGKCVNLTRASCFRHVLKGAESTKCVNLTRASRFRAVFAGRKIREMCEFEKSFVFRQPLCDSCVKCAGGIVILNNCGVCRSLAPVRFLREMRGRHRHIEQLTDWLTEL